MAIQTKRLSAMPNRPWLVLVALLIMLGCVSQHATAWPNANDAEDADGDGWYTAEKNLRVTLTLTGITSTKDGNYRVSIDGVNFSHTEKNLEPVVRLSSGVKKPMDCIAARRAVGTWLSHVGHDLPTWKSKIKLTRLDNPSVSADAVLTWKSKTGEPRVDVALSADEKVRLDFRVSLERFADPSPNDRNGDADRDGILDWEEAIYSNQNLGNIGLGDPGRRDMVLVVGHTHDAWKMTDRTRRLLKTRFFQREINLIIMAEGDETHGLCRPGLMKLGEKPLPRDHALSLREARRMRKEYLTNIPLRRHAHLVVLSARVAPDPANSWGYAELPGATLIVRSHLPMLGPDFHQYQAKTLMHELGHNLGLCHPTTSGQHCISGPIPKAERNPASSVMGTPRADRGNPMAVVTNAWSRPLDYSTTQWKNARLDWVRPENRPKKKRAPARMQNRKAK